MWVRLGVLLVPLAASVAVALAAVAWLPAPHGLAAHVAWWACVLSASYAGALLVERLARRALPLALLLRLSLVFPDRAPSRLQAARRTSLRELERQVGELHATDEPAQAARALVSLVGALGLHDRRTRGHSERVRAYVDLLTEELGLPEEDRVRLRWAALLHDVGKLSVPGTVLNGGRDLTEQEWDVLRRHPLEGERLAAGLMPWLGPWGSCVREHHERWDGSGYPAGLRGTEISLGARIVAVADAFEVMTANRSYQQAINATAAREELARCAGTDFDPAVVRAFLQVSLGRLRGVLGPLALAPLLPLTALADRAGRALQGVTAAAAATAVALVAPVAPAAHHPPAPRPAAPSLALAAPAPVAGTPSPPAARRSVRATTPAPRPRPARVVTRTPRPLPAPVPAAPAPLPGALYLTASGDLAPAAPAAAVATVPGSGTSAFERGVAAEAPLAGTARVLLFHDVQTRRGNGRPSASVRVSLSACTAGSCRTLATTTAALARTRNGYAEQSVSLGRVAAVVPAGAVLRLTVTLISHDNVTRLLVACGGTSASRLLLG
jgi:hypothetical protein